MELGLETSERVALELRNRGTPFITLSGYSREQRPLAFAEVPGQEKPIRPNLLIASIKRCMQKE